MLQLFSSTSLARALSEWHADAERQVDEKEACAGSKLSFFCTGTELSSNFQIALNGEGSKAAAVCVASTFSILCPSCEANFDEEKSLNGAFLGSLRNFQSGWWGPGRGKHEGEISNDRARQVHHLLILDFSRATLFLSLLTGLDVGADGHPRGGVHLTVERGSRRHRSSSWWQVCGRNPADKGPGIASSSLATSSVHVQPVAPPTTKWLSSLREDALHELSALSHSLSTYPSYVVCNRERLLQCTCARHNTILIKVKPQLYKQYKILEQD